MVLIERLDLGFGAGLTVLTGETGAGKSILLDSLGLALGARADAGLLRPGSEQASVAAVFAPPAEHPALALLAEHGIGAEDEIVLRRVLGRDGRSRAFANDAPIGVALLRRLGALLVEVQGQHEQMGLADPAGHAGLLDAYGVPPALRAQVAARHRAWRDAAVALRAAQEAIAPRSATRTGCATRPRNWPPSPRSPARRSGSRRSGRSCSRPNAGRRRSPPRSANSPRATGAAAPPPPRSAPPAGRCSA